MKMFQDILAAIEAIADANDQKKHAKQIATQNKDNLVLPPEDTNDVFDEPETATSDCNNDPFDDNKDETIHNDPISDNTTLTDQNALISDDKEMVENVDSVNETESVKGCAVEYDCCEREDEGPPSLQEELQMLGKHLYSL